MCEQGYLCTVCGAEVASISESELYLRYVIGELDPELLHTAPERHLRCNPVLAQFIEHEQFEPVTVAGPLDRNALDPEFVRGRVELVSRGFARLLQLEHDGGEGDVTTYPLPEAIARYKQR